MHFTLFRLIKRLILQSTLMILLSVIVFEYLSNYFLHFKFLEIYLLLIYQANSSNVKTSR